MDQPLPVLDQLVDQVRGTGSINRRAVEQAMGATLRETDDSNASFTFYAAAGVRSGDHRLGVDLRTPAPGGGATAGALLVLDVAGPCVARPAVEARYGPLTLSQGPRGRSEAEQAYWSRREAWGELSFGFAASAPGCLTSVVLTAARP